MGECAGEGGRHVKESTGVKVVGDDTHNTTGYHRGGPLTHSHSPNLSWQPLGQAHSPNAHKEAGKLTRHPHSSLTHPLFQKMDKMVWMV